MIKLIGNKGAKSSGPAGCFVPGCNGGGGGLGKSEFILYQVLGAFDSSRIYFIESVINKSILKKINQKINRKIKILNIIGLLL
tara:strand:- start:3328 stop:3576 length:249 start_codon:yes stop_codon:yes gene_type:complete